MSSIKVDPAKLEELSAVIKRFSGSIEGGEKSVNELVSQLVRDIRSQYSEWEVQSVLNEVEDQLRQLRRLAESVTVELEKKAGALSEASAIYRQDEEKTKKMTQQKYEPPTPSSFYAKGGELSGEGLSDYLADPLFDDPVIQKLHEQALHGTEEEQARAKEQLDEIFKARNSIARAQVAHAVYKTFGNTYLMDNAHKEAMKQREVLKQHGISDDLYKEGVNLSHLYKGNRLQACSYDPSFQITKDGKQISILMPQDNQYLYLLGLILEGGPKGAWAQKQLDEIHDQMKEIGRAQVAWGEYKAKNMKDEMDGAHAYAEKLRTLLKKKYSISSEMVDDVDFKYLWTGTGAAGKHLDVEEAEINPVSNLSSADEYRQALIDEAKYWVGKIPYCIDGVITTQILDRKNPPKYMDCSDFTSSVYKTILGIDIGINTKQQINRGVEVKYNDMKPGDLIFFDWGKNGSVDHVGIYIGDGKFIHETGSNDNPKKLDKNQNVKVESLDKNWGGRYGVISSNIYTIRRIINNDNTYLNIVKDGVKPLPTIFPPDNVPRQSNLNWIPKEMSLSGTSKQEKYLAKSLKKFTKLKWDQKKVHELWVATEQINNEYGIQIDPRLLLAIIIQEGTGSFNTSSTNKAADGQNGVEVDYAKDLLKANNLLFGKILGYVYYGDDFKSAAENNNKLPGISGTSGGILEYMNWNTPIIDLKQNKVREGVYAGNGNWYKSVSIIYDDLAYEGASKDYDQYISGINKQTVANISKGIKLPSFNFYADKDAQDDRGRPNGEFTINSKVRK
ncbi:NlpC/P60 family protein [Fontibacillus sp. BL9]|uniref:NlpC/P60 family protein n=1 Tax=Fontibacillus sp. BL9 TaxID=3389971 RepID=UPI00397D2B43